MTEKQAALLTKARASLQGAEALMRIRLYGFAASRGYYAMFYVAEALLLSRNLEFSSHAGVISAFGREFGRTGEVPPEYHRFIMDAQERRLMADYETGVEVAREKAELVLAHARQFLKLGEKMLGPATAES